MRTRRWVLSGVIVLLLFRLSAVAAAGETYTINANLATDPSTNTYRTLEEFRLAGIPLGVDDVVVLHNNDNTLTEALAGSTLNIRSAGNNRYTVSGATSASSTFGVFDIDAPAPSLTIDSLRVAGTANLGNPTVSVVNTGASSAGKVEIYDSLFENNGTTGVALTGIADTLFYNTQIKGTTTNVQLNGIGGGTAGNLDIVFDGNADLYNKWDGTLDVNANANINFDIAAGKYFTLGDGSGGVSIDINGAVTGVDILKTGGGTLKIGTNADFNSVSDLIIQQGTVQFNENALWVGNNIHVGQNGVFKPSVDFYNLIPWIEDPDNNPSPGAMSTFYLNSFTSEEGARLEIGNISTLPDFESVRLAAGYFGMFSLDTAASNIASTLRIDNKLMTAYIREITDDDDDVSGLDLPPGYYLTITNVNNLSVLDGVGSYADIYRMGPISELERDMLDSIYARGGTSGMDRGFLQTVGGSIVQNSLLALRHNNANVISKVNRRLTSYQKSELESNPLDVDSSGMCAYQECDPVESYGEMWAFLDQGWMSQNDVDSLAGYRMSTTTLGIGYDKHEDQWIYGGMLAYATSDMKLKSQSATRSDIENLMAALYASWAQDGWYLSGTGIASYGWNDSRSVYTLPGLNLTSRTGDYATYGVGVNLETGYMMETEAYGVPFRVTPYGSLTYARLQRNSVNDAGAYNDDIDLRKHFRAGNWNTWDAALGVRLAAPMEIYGATVVPSLDLSWTRVTGERTPSNGLVHMYNNPSGVWDLDLMSSNRSSVRLIAGVDAKIRENVSLGASYEFEWRKEYWNNRLNINMSLEF